MDDLKLARLTEMAHKADQMDDFTYQEASAKLEAFRKVMADSVERYKEIILSEPIQTAFTVIVNDSAMSALVKGADVDERDPSLLLAIGMTLGMLYSEGNEPMRNALARLPDDETAALTFVKAMNNAVQSALGESLTERLMAKMPTKGGVH